MAARNTVQFQKGLSEATFRAQYGTEDLCGAAVFAMRWPDGFVCPACGGTEYTLVTTRQLYQCCRCRHQASLTAGTIFHASTLALSVWFQAMYHLTQSKTGISSLELARRLGVTQTTAWTLKHKLLQVMLEREAETPLAGRIDMDDAYLGGERSGGKRGRGAPGKTPFLAAVETTAEGKPVRLKLRRVKGFRRVEVEAFAQQSFDPASTVVSDGLDCFTAVTKAGCTHQPIVTGSGRASARHPAFKVGQHRTRQPQGGDHRHLPRCPRQACAALPRRIHLPLQSALRPCLQDRAPHLGRPADPADAVPPAQMG